MNILITNMKEETLEDGCTRKRELHLCDDGSVVDAHGKNVGIYGKKCRTEKVSDLAASFVSAEVPDGKVCPGFIQMVTREAVQRNLNMRTGDYEKDAKLIAAYHAMSADNKQAVDTAIRLLTGSDLDMHISRWLSMKEKQDGWTLK